MLSRLLLSLARWSLFELRHGHRQEDARTRASSLRPALPISKHMQIARERTGPSSDSDPTVSFSPWSTTVSCKLYSPPLRLLRGIAIQAHAHPTNALVGPSGAASYPSSGTGPLAGLGPAEKDSICTKSPYDMLIQDAGEIPLAFRCNRRVPAFGRRRGDCWQGRL